MLTEDQEKLLVRAIKDRGGLTLEEKEEALSTALKELVRLYSRTHTEPVNRFIKINF